MIEPRTTQEMSNAFDAARHERSAAFMAMIRALWTRPEPAPAAQEA